jgi:hypothetical protein
MFIIELRVYTTGMSMGHPSRARKSTWGADNACMVRLSTCHYLDWDGPWTFQLSFYYVD